MFSYAVSLLCMFCNWRRLFWGWSDLPSRTSLPYDLHTYIHSKLPSHKNPSYNLFPGVVWMSTPSYVCLCYVLILKVVRMAYCQGAPDWLRNAPALLAMQQQMKINQLHSAFTCQAQTYEMGDNSFAVDVQWEDNTLTQGFYQTLSEPLVFDSEQIPLSPEKTTHCSWQSTVWLTTYNSNWRERATHTTDYTGDIRGSC